MSWLPSVGPLGLRRLWGALAVLSLLLAVVFLVGRQWTNGILMINLYLSVQALYQQARVEVKVDPQIVDPAADTPPKEDT